MIFLPRKSAKFTKKIKAFQASLARFVPFCGKAFSGI
jgi:hypothetical protein